MPTRTPDHLDIKVQIAEYGNNQEVYVYNANTQEWVLFESVSSYATFSHWQLRRKTNQAKRHYALLDKQGVQW